MNNYIFCDVSHWEGKLDFQAFASAGHRLMIAKASDSYNMPDKSGQYTWNPQKHHDAYFVDNYVGARSVGMLAAGYHFIRFDRTVEENINNYLDALSMLPEEYHKETGVVGIMDMEQSAGQIEILGKAYVSDKAVDIADAFHSHFEKLIFYSGSWWTDQWLTEESLQTIAEMATCWEPEYPKLMLSSDKQGVSALYQNYVPTVPNGFLADFALTADDTTGKLFAHQFSDKALFPPNTASVDINRTELNKEELYKFFGQSGEVDPPNPDNPNYDDEFFEMFTQLDRMEESIDYLEVQHELILSLLAPEEPEEPVEETIFKQVDRNGKPVYLFFESGQNTQGKPIFQIYPSDTSEVKDRISVPSGTQVEVYANGRTIGDGGVVGWKTVKDYGVAEKLYVLEKFIV